MIAVRNMSAISAALLGLLATLTALGLTPMHTAPALTATQAHMCIAWSDGLPMTSLTTRPHNVYSWTTECAVM